MKFFIDDCERKYYFLRKKKGERYLETPGERIDKRAKVQCKTKEIITILSNWSDLPKK